MEVGALFVVFECVALVQKKKRVFPLLALRWSEIQNGGNHSEERKMI